MMSGMRKPSPISISSPRETMTSPPAASSFSARKTAAALLLTAMAGRAQQAFQQRRGVDVALAAAAGGEIVFEIGIAGDDGHAAPSGARPRLVCRTTPVALMTRRERRPFQGRQGARRRARRWRGRRELPARISSRAASRRAGLRHTTSARGKRASAGRRLLEHFMHGRQVARSFSCIGHEFDGTSKLR